MPTSTSMKGLKTAPTNSTSNGRPSLHRGEPKVTTSRTRLGDSVRVKKPLTAIGTASKGNTTTTTTATTSSSSKKPLVATKRSTSAQRVPPPTTISRSATTSVQITPALRSVSPGGQQTRGHSRTTTTTTSRQNHSQLAPPRKAETMKIRRTSLTTSGGDISTSRSVTSSPAAARRLSEKPVRRSVSPAAAYRRQSSGSYYRSDTTCIPVPVPSLKMGRVERSHTMSSETTPRASTARPFSSPGRERLNTSATASPKINSSVSRNGTYSNNNTTTATTTSTTAVNSQAEHCTQLSSLVSLSDTEVVVDDLNKKQCVEGREMVLSWLTTPSEVPEVDYFPTAIESDSEGEHAVEESSVLCLTDAMHQIRKYTLKARRGEGNTAGRSAINSAVKGASKCNSVALNLCLEHLASSNPRSGFETLHSIATTLGTDDGRGCGATAFSLIREASLTKNTSKKISRSKRSKFDSVLKSIWDSGIPIEIASGHADGIGGYELLCEIDDSMSCGLDVPVIACITTTLDKYLKESHSSPNIPYCSSSLYAMKKQGNVLFIMSASSLNRVFLDLFTRCGITIFPTDSSSEDFLKPFHLKSGSVLKEFRPEKKYINSGSLPQTIFSSLRACLDVEATPSKSRQFNKRQSSVIVSNSYSTLVCSLFNDVLPLLRKEFLRVLSPQGFHEDKVKYCQQFNDKVESAAKVMNSEIREKIQVHESSTTTTTNHNNGIYVTSQEFDEIENQVQKLLQGIREDGENALLHDMFISLRHHAIASAPMAETSVALVRVLHSNDFNPNSIDTTRLKSEVLNTFDDTAFALCTQVHSTHVNNDSWIKDSVKTIAAEYISQPQYYKPSGVVAGSSTFVPTLANLSRNPSAIGGGLTGEVSDGVMSDFLKQLQSRITNILNKICHPSTWDIGRPSHPITETFCRCIHEAVNLEKIILWPEGCRLKPCFYTGLLNMLQGELVREFCIGEENRLKNIIDIEVSSARTLINSSLSERTAVKVVSKYVASVHAQALKMGVLRAFQVDISTYRGTNSFTSVFNESLSVMKTHYEEETNRFADHVSNYGQSDPVGVWDSFFAYLQSFRSSFFKTANTFAVIVPFNRLDAAVVSFQGFISSLPNDVRSCLSSSLRVPDSMISRAEFLPPLGFARGQPIPSPSEALYSIEYWGLSTAQLLNKSDAAESDCWTALTSSIPVPELPFCLLASSPTTVKEEKRIVVEWPPRLYFSLSVPDVVSAPTAYLRFDSHGSYCIITDCNPISLISSSEVVAMEESRDGYVCIPLNPGEYTALVCNSGGRSKLQLVDGCGGTLSDGGVQVLPHINHQNYNLSVTNFTIENMNDRLGPLTSPSWVSLAQVSITIRGSEKQSILLSGTGCAFALFKGTERIKTLNGTSTDLVSVCKAKTTPFGEMASTLIEAGDYIMIPYVPTKATDLCLSSNCEGSKALASQLQSDGPSLQMTEVVTAKWDFSLNGNETSPQFLIKITNPDTYMISIYNSANSSSAGWMIHSLDGELIKSCDSYLGIGSDNVQLSSCCYIITTIINKPLEAIQSKKNIFEVSAQIISSSSTQPELSLLDDRNHILCGEWVGVSAGGGIGATTFCYNPQYAICSSDTNSEVIITMETSTPAFGGLVVFERDGSSLYRDLTIRSKPIAVSTVQSDEHHFVKVEFTAMAGQYYTVVPYLLERVASEECFNLFIKSSSSLSIASPVLEWPVGEHIDGSWEGTVTSDALSSPQFVVSVKRGVEAVVSLAAFGLGSLVCVFF